MRTIAIVGLGGVGSWVAYQIAKEKLIKRLILIDEDIVEKRNLHRTPYTMKHVGKKKVDAIAEIIEEINPKIIILKYPMIFTEKFILPKKIRILINATDDINMHAFLPEVARREDCDYIRGNYSGNHYTIDYRAEYKSWGENVQRQYPITPKIWTAQTVASHVTFLVKLFLSKDEEDIKELNKISAKYNEIYTAYMFNLY